MLAMAVPRRFGCGAMYMLSHADDDAFESCWRWQCRDDLAVARCTCRVMLAMVLPSHASDGTVEVTWP
jgi:hypothetical protein